MAPWRQWCVTCGFVVEVFGPSVNQRAIRGFASSPCCALYLFIAMGEIRQAKLDWFADCQVTWSPGQHNTWALINNTNTNWPRHIIIFVWLWLSCCSHDKYPRRMLRAATAALFCNTACSHVAAPVMGESVRQQQCVAPGQLLPPSPADAVETLQQAPSANNNGAEICRVETSAQPKEAPKQIAPQRYTVAPSLG